MGFDRPSTPPDSPEPRPRSRQVGRGWRTSLTCIEPNTILVRGYPVDEMMGRVSFSEAIYLLFTGELPPPAIGRILSAVLVSCIDHGVTPPSTVAARNVASTGAPLGQCVAAGISGFGPLHGGDVGACMRLLDAALAQVRTGTRMDEAARQVVNSRADPEEPPPGFGHRYHTRDPRAPRLLQMAMECEVEGEHVRMLRAFERALQERPPGHMVNVDGAIAAVCADLGFDPDMGNALFLIARVPGLIAHAHEEQLSQPAMRQIDVSAHVYDGPRERRLPERRR